MNNRKYLNTNLKEFISERKVSYELVLYRGTDDETNEPKDNKYSFFAKDKSFAQDYGEYIWECTFNPVKLFVSYEIRYIKELYRNGFKLRDPYVEDKWDDEIYYHDLYDYDLNGNKDDWGYKSPEHLFKSRHIDSDTWEMIEKTEGVIDYIISKYDGVILLEGGMVTYLIDTDKIKEYRLLT